MGNEVMTAQIFELSNQKHITGRRKFKAVLHEIFPSSNYYQTNGISWSETYTLNALDSIPGMSICVEFVNDERSLPYSHGLTGIRDGDNMPLMENATMVGSFNRGYIQDMEVDGATKRVLVAEGTIDEIRYPKFVQWLADRLSNGVVKGSIEIVGHPENDNHIIYEDGWKEKGRVPQIYDYSGYAILGVRPADDTAIVMELNNKDGNMEGLQMDEKLMSQFADSMKAAVATAISEASNRNEQYESRITELNAQIADKDAQIAELNANLEAANADIAAKTQTIENQNAELNSLKDANISLANDKKVAELNAALNEFSEDEQGLAKEEIDAFRADPASMEINSITDKICREMVRMNKEAVRTAQNSSAPDIFGGVGEPQEDDGNIF